MFQMFPTFCLPNLYTRVPGISEATFAIVPADTIRESDSASVYVVDPVSP